MEIRRVAAALDGGHIEYPQFSGARGAARMNRFYTAWRGAASACAAGLKHGELWCDYTLREETGRVTVVCRLRLLRRGRTAAQRTYTQVWEDGCLVPPAKKKKEKRKPAPEA